MTELILIRHGETDWNRELRFQGQIDVPLNATGHEQARRIGLRLAQEDVHTLVCSDLMRAQQTALPVTQNRPSKQALQPILDVALREQSFGVIEGLLVADIKAQFPDEWAQWMQFDADYAFAGGESVRQFHTRVLAVVTHGGVLDMIYRSAKALPLSGPRQSLIPNAGLNRVRIEGEAINILEWADIEHLSDMPPQPVYDQRKRIQTTCP
jgi:2,3-bisphosphoglycerate-dependent phosphoglycerate mutase